MLLFFLLHIRMSAELTLRVILLTIVTAGSVCTEAASGKNFDYRELCNSSGVGAKFLLV